MAWIKVIDFDEATGSLRSLYNRIAGTRGRVDNVLSIHSLRPQTLSGHLALYKSVLHHTSNVLPLWFLESIGVLVSEINGCRYCAAHHAAGMRRALKDEASSDQIIAALRDRKFEGIFKPQHAVALRYAERLTEVPSSINEQDIVEMRSAGLSDGEILEVNQVAAYFAYANRTVDGLGVTTDGDELGLSPRVSDDLEDVSHA